jgi:hypothetical protein
MSFSLYLLACLSFFILQLGWLSTTIISRVNSRVLTLFLLVESPLMTGRTMLADPFREILMHSRGVVYMIVYINGLKCTIFTIFYFKSCRTVELSYVDSN